MYEHLWNFDGTYRFTVLVAGDGVAPASRKIDVVWSKKWETFTARDAGPGEI